MTYSNTNRDKVQAVGAGLLAGALIISALANIARQYREIRLAEKKSQEIARDISEIRQEIVFLRENLKYATSSAAKDRVLRGKLGLGTNNDYWIKFPPEADIFTNQ